MIEYRREVPAAGLDPIDHLRVYDHVIDQLARAAGLNHNDRASFQDKIDIRLTYARAGEENQTLRVVGRIEYPGPDLVLVNPLGPRDKPDKYLVDAESVPRPKEDTDGE